MTDELRQMLEAISEKLEALEEKLDELYDLARIEGLHVLEDEPEDLDAMYGEGRW